jgi:hypothetical protein
LFTESLVLKGGTALKKAFFQDYRFSEDLDFSTQVEIAAADIQDGIDTAVSIMEQDLQKREPFFIQSEPLILREPHPGKQIAYIVRVQFPYHREPMCRLKVEITVDEQSLDRLQKKGWGANRVCRDYYDLWSIQKRVDLSNHNIPALLNKKSVVRGVKFKSIDQFFDKALLEVANNEWDKLLIPFIPHRVSLETVRSELQSFTQSLWVSKEL